ncbi:MAG: DUF3623 domain-containing protein [Devosiaceae bacterium]|nr:DUF3623 domain-containing protein [Devosiaceae bacterium MH13]
MLTLALPMVFALFIWWFSTGLILLADRLPAVSERALMVGASMMALAALGAVWLLRDVTTVPAAYGGFVAGLVLWGWHEASFLSGSVTGGRRTACPPGARGWRRFVYAAQTLIHHELAIAATALALALMVWGSANEVALWTFVILWGMRLSTKFNIFLGVPNVTEEFLPSRLNYLKTYFRTRALNLLFPFSVTLGTGAVFWLSHLVLGAATPFEQAGYTLLATLAALGVLEHWFLVLPFRDQELWRWYLRRQATGAIDPADGPHSHPNTFTSDTPRGQPSGTARSSVSSFSFQQDLGVPAPPNAFGGTTQ